VPVLNPSRFRAKRVPTHSEKGVHKGKTVIDENNCSALVPVPNPMTFFFFFFCINLRPLKSDQLPTTPLSVNRDPLQTS